jgi:NADPH:quinone reductase-like Zn-dependent oxidoreductase
MSTSHAAAFAEPGPPEVLQLVTRDVPLPGTGEVLLRARAAGVQPADVALRRQGWGPPGVEITLPQVPGNEVAGIVQSVGPGVEDWSPGDEVLGWRMFECYAEHVVMPADQLVAKPPTLAWEIAGALSASGQTAYNALKQLGVGPGDTLLVHAAAGGVGTVAVQLAQLWGARVIGTASERNHDYLRALGVTPVLYGDGLVERVRAAAPGGVDAALDAAGRDALAPSLELVADRERVGTIADFANAPKLGVHFLRSERTQARLSELAGLAASGELQITVSGRYALAQAAEAQREVESGHVRGKVVLTLG